MKRPKSSFLLSMSLIFLVGYALSDLAHFVVSNLSYYDDYQQGRTIQMLNYARLGAVLLKHDEVGDLGEELKEARQLHQIDFYLLKKDGNLIVSGGMSWPTPSRTAPGPGMQAMPEGPSDKAAPDEPDIRPGAIVVSDHETYLSYQKEGYLLVMGINTRRSAYLWYLATQNRASLIFDILAVALLASGIALYCFKDLQTLVRAIRNKGEKHYQELNPGLIEARIMLQGLKSYESRVQRLRSERIVLRTQLPSAVRSELDSRRSPPYQFGCTMARTDINQYSVIYAEHPVEEFMAVVNEFLSRASEVITRYGGYIAGYVGDEIIYYFKDEDHLDSAAIAVSAIRDIHAVAERLHAKTQPGRGYPFRVKSAIASGSLRFGRQVDDFALSGAVFVETVRILSHVEERLQNAVYLPSRLVERVSPVCRSFDRKEVELKGIPGVSHLHQISGFRDAIGIWGALGEENALLLTCFLNESDTRYGLSELLRLLSFGGATAAMTLALKAMCQARTPYEDEGIHRAYRWLLAELIRRCEQDGSVGDEEFRLLSLAISGARALIPRNRFDSNLRELMGRCLGIEERRVISNAIEAFSHFDPGCKDKSLLGLLDYPDNRVLANTLVKLGIANLDRVVISGLRGMLRSGRAEMIASGAFAVGELARFYFNEDPLFFETHLPFQELVREVSALGAHSSEMVQRQVRAAIRKTQPALREAAA